jgi:hypothetical protein
MRKSSNVIPVEKKAKESFCFVTPWLCICEPAAFAKESWLQIHEETYALHTP